MKCKGRKPKLSPEEVEHIRDMYHNKNLRENPQTLAHLFRVTPTTICAVIDRKGAYADRA